MKRHSDASRQDACADQRHKFKKGRCVCGAQLKAPETPRPIDSMIHELAHRTGFSVTIWPTTRRSPRWQVDSDGCFAVRSSLRTALAAAIEMAKSR